MTDKTLEVDLGDELIHQIQAIKKFEGRRVNVEDSVHGVIVGINMGYNGRRGFYSVSNEGNPQVLFPQNLTKMTLLEVKEGDEMRIRHSYFEVTDKTIDVTKKAAQRYRT